MRDNPQIILRYIEIENELDKMRKSIKRQPIKLHKTDTHTERSRLELFNIVQALPRKRGGHYRVHNPDKNGTALYLRLYFWSLRNIFISNYILWKKYMYPCILKLRQRLLNINVLAVSSYLKPDVWDSHIHVLNGWFGNTGMGILISGWTRSCCG